MPNVTKTQYFARYRDSDTGEEFSFPVVKAADTFYLQADNGLFPITLWLPNTKFKFEGYYSQDAPVLPRPADNEPAQKPRTFAEAQAAQQREYAAALAARRRGRMAVRPF